MLARILTAVVAALCLSSLAFAEDSGEGGDLNSHFIYRNGEYIGILGVPLPPPAEIGNYRNIHSVAVLTAFAGKLYLTSNKLFSNKMAVDVSSWGLDDFAMTVLRRHLSSRFEVKNPNYDRAALAAIPSGDSQESTKALSAYLGAIPNAGVDAFVVVRPDAVEFFRESGGLELLSSSDRLPSTWIGFDIEIIDAHSFQRIAKCFSRVRLREGVPADYAVFYASADLRLNKALSPTETQMILLRADFGREIAATLVETLRALQLGLALPKPGEGKLVPISPEQTPYRDVHSVAVISAIGDELTLGYRGTMFRHGFVKQPIGDWNSDSEIESRIIAALDRRYVVKSVPVDRAALAKSVVSPMERGLSAAIGNLPSTTDVDAYIVVLKHNEKAELGLDEASGVGIWRRMPFGAESTLIFAHYEIVVLDARTLRPLRAMTSVPSPRYPTPFVYRAIDNAVWLDGTTVLSQDHAAEVHQALGEIIADSLGETLMRMGLTGFAREPVDWADSTIPVSSVAWDSDDLQPGVAGLP